MKPRVVITHAVHQEVLDLLGAECDLDANQTPETLPAEEVVRRVSQADAMMAFMPDRVDAAFLDACPKLRVIGAALKGYDNFDVAVCAARGVWLSFVPDLLTVPTAELAIGLTIGLTRKMIPADARVRGGKFAGWRPEFYGLGISGSTIGIVGMGAIGMALAERLKGWGAVLLYADRTPASDAVAARLGIARRSLDGLLAEADILILALSLAADTVHVIDERALGLMKPGAYLVNPCRGSVVSEAAVLTALTSGRLGGYAADVFEFEDRSREDRPRQIQAGLLNHPDTIFSPHIGSAVQKVRLAIELRAAENILQVLSGKQPMDAANEPGQVT
ncbi:MAG TPA: hydroxyacid dehydrogenase [Aurantimonas coralicida]|uniref:Hydroxyacid dehydrogenase n=2 Tax=root TaxID=1 RepID=A0A9C9NEW4_9HYPH|nr:hydroxyacid dehydrogenase [Aurantimonas coralicida]HET99994.1 hydroxyacid dehydrogenase [Aurantimonas coralicida]